MEASTKSGLVAAGIAATAGGSLLAAGLPQGEWVLYLAVILAGGSLIPWGKMKPSKAKKPKGISPPPPAKKSPDEELAYEADKMADRLRGLLFSSRRGARLLDNMALRDFIAVNGNDLHHLGKKINKRYPDTMYGSLVPNSYEDVERASKWLEKVAECLRAPKP